MDNIVKNYNKYNSEYDELIERVKSFFHINQFEEKQYNIKLNDDEFIIELFVKSYGTKFSDFERIIYVLNSISTLFKNYKYKSETKFDKKDTSNNVIQMLLYK